MDDLIDWAKSIIYCMFFLKLLEGFVSDSHFGRYFNFVSGIILIMLILKPFSVFLADDYSVDEGLIAIISQIDEKSFELNQEMYSNFENNLDIKIYEKSIANNVESLIKNEDYEITSVKVDISEEAKSYGRIDYISVDIQINQDVLDENILNNISEASLGVYYKKDIENQLINFYNIEPSNIDINVK